jgi:hypothetical protein
MKNIILLLSIIILSVSQSLAQDRLFFLNGDETDVKITEISSSEVKYKRLDNLEGPSFSTLKTELFMIKYANGDKEMITAQTAEPVPTEQEDYTTNNAEQTSPSSNSESGLSSAVVVTDQPSSASLSNVDKWGRTQEDNMRLYKKKLVKGGVLLGVGGVMIIPGIILFARANQFENAGLDGDPLRIGGALLSVGGLAMLVAGSAIMGSSAKYKKRANQLANGNASLSPSIMNIHSYSGAAVNSQAGYGLTFSYTF